jgi:hypothetical protein
VVTTTIRIGLRAHLPHRSQMTYDAVGARLGGPFMGRNASSPQNPIRIGHA